MFGLNPYLIIGALLALSVSHGIAYFVGGEHKENEIKAAQLDATNEAIDQAEVQAKEDNVIVRNVEVEKEVIKYKYIKVREQVNENIDKNPAYTECGLDANGLQLFNYGQATKEINSGKSIN